jgi:hypothetical protein
MMVMICWHAPQQWGTKKKQQKVTAMNVTIERFCTHFCGDFVKLILIRVVNVMLLR